VTLWSLLLWAQKEGAVGDVEIVGRVERRRKWSLEEKAALLAEIEAEGGRVTVVARRHGISESLLYNWRSAWKMAASLSPAELEFMPIGVIGPAPEERGPLLPTPEPPTVSRRPDDRAGMIEIALPGGARVSVDALVNERALARVLRALKGMA
jgi:transposase